MKTIQNLILLIAPVFFLTQLICANSKQNNGSILVKGKILYEESKAKKVIVKLYEHNELVQAQILESTHNINLNLDRNTEYTIEITSDGFFDKRVKISTMNLEPNVNPSAIKFTAVLLLKNNLEESDDFLMDFPWAVYKYSKTKKQFVLDEDYTYDMIKDVDRLYKSNSPQDSPPKKD